MADRRPGSFKRWLRSSKAYPFVLLQALLIATLAGCEFEPALTPIDWSTPLPEAAQFAEIGSTPIPLPTPTSSFVTPEPSSIPFRGEDDLDCAQPKAGDNNFGYCNIPGTQDFYVWGECPSDCPDSPYPGIELIIVSKDDSELFREVINKLETAQDVRRESNFIGGFLGGVGAGLGIPTVVAVCLGTGGWGCVLAGGILLIDLGVSSFELIKGAGANRELTEPNGLEESAVDQFQQLSAEYDPLDERQP